MKLRNKNTGEVVDAYSINAQDEIIRIQYFTKNGMLNHFDFDSIEEMNNVFEDYKPAEPLIKDEKIRKAVRAWAEVNLISDILYDKDTSAEYMMIVNNKNTQYETRTITPLYNADGDVLVYDETL